MTDDADILIETSGLSLVRGGREVVRSVHVTVRRGEVVAVLGPNGAGKSTLLAGVSGTLAPASGSVRRTGRVAFAMQSGALASRSARANVELALAWWGVPRAERRPRAVESLEQMMAGHLANRPISGLSGGERRRIHLARAIATRPDVLLLDEPFTALDTNTRDSLVEQSAGVLRQSAGAVVMVVHDRSEAWALADRVIVMLNGAVVADDDPDALLAQPPSVDVARFLGFTGELRERDGLVLLRPHHVRLVASNGMAGVVTGRTRLEDAVRLDVKLATGSLQVLDPLPGAQVGDQVNVAYSGGARFPGVSGTEQLP